MTKRTTVPLSSCELDGSADQSIDWSRHQHLDESLPYQHHWINQKSKRLKPSTECDEEKNDRLGRRASRNRGLKGRTLCAWSTEIASSRDLLNQLFIYWTRTPICVSLKRRSRCRRQEIQSKAKQSTRCTSRLRWSWMRSKRTKKSIEIHSRPLWLTEMYCSPSVKPRTELCRWDIRSMTGEPFRILSHKGLKAPLGAWWITRISLESACLTPRYKDLRLTQDDVLL